MTTKLVQCCARLTDVENADDVRIGGEGGEKVAVVGRGGEAEESRWSVWCGRGLRGNRGGGGSGFRDIGGFAWGRGRVRG